MSGLREKLLRIMSENERNRFVLGTCSDVEDDKVCTLTPLDGGAPYFNVRLRPELDEEVGVYSIPSDGSLALAAQLGDENNLTMLVVQKAKRVVIAGETLELNGADWVVLKGEETIREIKKLKAAVDAIIAAIQAAPIVPLDGGLTFKTALVGAISSLQTGNFNGLINKTVKHGAGL